MDSNIAQALNEMDDDSKGVFVSFTSELMDKLDRLIWRFQHSDGKAVNPIDFATFVGEVKGECNALGRLASFLDGEA